MSPKAGAHGELCGLVAIKGAAMLRAKASRGAPAGAGSAHGTNPATAAFAGFTVDAVPAGANAQRPYRCGEGRRWAGRGRHHAHQPQHLRPVRGGIQAIAEAVHDAGAYFIPIGANFNAIVGKR